MNFLPTSLKMFAQEAEDLVNKNQFGDIEFSGATYQVEVRDPKENRSYWVFLQLDERGSLRDSFCSCDHGDTQGCVHQAAAFLRVYQGGGRPLHERYEASFWNCLCRIYAKNLGLDPSIIKKKARLTFSTSSPDQQRMFLIRAKDQQSLDDLKEILFYRKVETEETSLKFSNLSREEIALWREGNPSDQLSYQLSFWYDLGKWLMILQEAGEKYEISFRSSSKTKLPEEVIIKFPQVELKCTLLPSDLNEIVLSLETVDSPLKVHHTSSEGIEKIEYNKNQRSFLVSAKANLLDKAEGIFVDGWTFVPSDGFYSRLPEIFVKQKIIPEDEVENILDTYLPIFQQKLQGTPLDPKPHRVSYVLHFDAKWNLHIVPYLFQKGDLDPSNNQLFGHWVHLDALGFFRLDKEVFGDRVIAASEISRFVSQNAAWLNTIKGFHTHVSSLEVYLTYWVTDDDHLFFSPKLGIQGEILTAKDFERWVYIKEHGFFPKVSTPIKLSFAPGRGIKKDEIAMFIRKNREELPLVPGFFASKCPIERSGILLEVIGKGTIRVIPQYIIAPEYQDKKIRIFDSYTYVPGEGFYELPPHIRLPDPYGEEQEIEPENIIEFLEQDYPILSPRILSLDQKLQKPKKMELVATNIALQGQGDYSLKLEYLTEKGGIPLTQIWQAYQEKKEFIFTEHGFISLRDPRFVWIRQIGKKKINKKTNTFQLSAIEVFRLHALESLDVSLSSSDVEQEKSLQIFKELIELTPPEAPDLRGLKSILRPYQENGVRWLWFLYHHNLSGLLCDDMGLGKTHQAMALFQAIRNKEKKELHFLVICPTSVIYHWEEKLNDFLPGFKVRTLHGPNRDLEVFYRESGILLTSYGIWKNQEEELKEYFFDAAIFDEVQIAKNHLSRVHHSLQQVNAKMRIGLTGTPIENRLRELKSLFDLVLPGYFPPDKEYRERFVVPIEMENNEESKELLSRLIKPFVLRRKKATVLQDLPAKTEEIALCELCGDQKVLYEQVLNKSRDRLIQQLSDDETPVPYIHIFSLFSHLKQICDHPAVYYKKAVEYKNHASGKWNLFIELLEEALASQQKVVVFSQYLVMLDIIEEYLREQEIEFASIRGATTERGEQLKKFKENPQCQVFVGSLHAAGLGVDLTAASVVIHYDRWWNAARENQATDRVHRIGQERGVQVFKLMTKNTLEEHIDHLIRKKAKMMESLIGVDDHQLMKTFDRKEIIDLLLKSRLTLPDGSLGL